MYEAQAEGEGCRGMECAWEAGPEHGVGEIVHEEMLDSQARIASATWSAARIEARSGKAERKRGW